MDLYVERLALTAAAKRETIAQTVRCLVLIGILGRHPGVGRPMTFSANDWDIFVLTEVKKIPLRSPQGNFLVGLDSQSYKDKDIRLPTKGCR